MGRRFEAWGEERITYGGDIFTGELVRRVRDEKTRLRAGRTQASRYGELACGGGREGETHLADRTVSYNNTLDRLHGSPGGLVGSSGGSWVRGRGASHHHQRPPSIRALTGKTLGESQQHASRAFPGGDVRGGRSLCRGLLLLAVRCDSDDLYGARRPLRRTQPGGVAALDGDPPDPACTRRPSCPATLP